jgi:hypothetical protein
VVLAGNEESKIQNCWIAPLANLKRQWLGALVVLWESPDAIGVGLSEAIYALVVVSSAVDFNTAVCDGLDDCQIAAVEILVFVNQEMGWWAINGEIRILLQGTLQLVHKLGAKHVAVDGSMFPPSPEKLRIRKSPFPIRLFSRQALPVRGQLVQKVTSVIESLQAKKLLQILLDDVSFLPVICYAQGLRQQGDPS